MRPPTAPNGAAFTIRNPFIIWSSERLARNKRLFGFGRPGYCRPRIAKVQCLHSAGSQALPSQGDTSPQSSGPPRDFSAGQLVPPLGRLTGRACISE